MGNIKKFLKTKHALWSALTSPKTVSLLKLGIAVVGVIHAIEEFKDSSGTGKRPIGFKNEEEE
mgnify:CR=1 FL=1